MSKAFTREDDLPEQTATRRFVSALPPGAKNYITPGGAQRLQADLERLVTVERPQLARAKEEGRERLAALDARIEQLHRSLESAVIVNPPDAREDRVRFGATVTVREINGQETTYRIVGVDETDIDRDWVSWLSPIAKALMNAQVGDRVRLRLAGGTRELEIVRITYE